MEPTPIRSHSSSRATSGFERHHDSIAAGNILTQHYEAPILQEVDIHDESLRDGEQTVGLAFSLERKLQIARGLLDAGVRYLSLGYPAVSDAERDAVRTLAKLGDPSGFSCLSRATPGDIQAVVACDIPNVALFIGISDVHLARKLRMSEHAAYERMRAQLALARSHGLSARFGLEDATRAPIERIKRFALGALEAGANMVTIPDTCGVLTPLTAFRLFRDLTSVLGPGRLAAHFHNDLGMATANTLAACAGGARLVQGTLGGIGERAGNANLEQLVLGLKVKYGVDTGIDPEKVRRLSLQMAEWVRFPIPPNQPISGAYAFSHESGIHVHGILQDAACYEPFPPELVGCQHVVRYGKHSGSSNLKYLAHLLGLQPSDAVLDDVLALVKRRSERGEAMEAAEIEQLLRERSERPEAVEATPP